MGSIGGRSAMWSVSFVISPASENNQKGPASAAIDRGFLLVGGGLLINNDWSGRPQAREEHDLAADWSDGNCFGRRSGLAGLAAVTAAGSGHPDRARPRTVPVAARTPGSKVRDGGQQQRQAPRSALESVRVRRGRRLRPRTPHWTRGRTGRRDHSLRGGGRQ